MKSIRGTIWVLLAFVVIATLDSQPDPPAVNPSSTLCKILQHDCSCAPAAERCDSLVASSIPPVRLVAADACQPLRPNDRLILTVQAADPSPPSSQAPREPSFQS
jgi:hypothetical protein